MRNVRGITYTNSNVNQYLTKCTREKKEQKTKTKTIRALTIAATLAEKCKNDALRSTYVLYEFFFSYFFPCSPITAWLVTMYLHVTIAGLFSPRDSQCKTVSHEASVFRHYSMCTCDIECIFPESIARSGSKDKHKKYR